MNSRPTGKDEIFNAAAEIADASERSAFLVAACGDDLDLLTELRELLAHDAAEASLLDRTTPGISKTIASDAQIGPYKLLQQIGEGGFGVVYMALQQKPVRREVALKIIKPGMDTKEVIARFEAERQALALMDHPNIAKVLDAGETEQGRPFFVMELVKGVPLTEFCDRNKLSSRDRLDLFITICRAVQHAHQKGIIHRDLKPSNVMVTVNDNKPVPKIIDFGVSKAISQQLTERTLFTRYGQMMGTPVYMSPEQAQMTGLDIDTRSDVYSLGILLYELLTGTTPLDTERLRQTAYAEIQRLIAEEEAPKPSVRLSTPGNHQADVALYRDTDPKSLRQFVNGDLDWIVMKAIDKDRNRRYESASRFAEDIERFLKNDEVEARPPSTFYSLSKFARRNRGPVITASALLLTICVGLIGTTLGLIEASRKTKEAETAKTRMATERDRAVKAEQQMAAAQSESERTAEQRRRELYAANMQQADQIWNSPKGTLRQIEELLAEWIPVKGQEDLREFSWRYQWNRLHPKSVFTIDNTAAATLGEDGLLVIADDAGIKKYDASGNLVAQCWTGNASNAVLSTDGSWVALPGQSKTRLIQLSSASEPNPVADQSVQQTSVYELPGSRRTFSSDGKLLACWSAKVETETDTKITVWEITGTSPQRVRSIQLSAVDAMPEQGDFILASDGESYLLKEVPHWNAVPPNDIIAVLKDYGEPVICRLNGSPGGACVWSPTGDSFAVGNLTGKIHLSRTSSPRDSIVLASHGKQTTAMELSQDGTRLVSGGSDGTIDVWEIATEPIRIRTFKAHVEAIRSISLSSDATEFVSTDESGMSKWWHIEDQFDRGVDLKSLAPRHYRTPLGISTGFDANSTTVESLVPGSPAADSGRISKGDKIIAISDGSGEMQSVAGKFFDEVVDLLIIGEPGAKVRVELQRASDGGYETVELERRPSIDSNEKTYRVAFAPDGLSLAIAHRHGGLIWKLGETAARRIPVLPCSVAYSPDSRLLAMNDRTQIVLWDLEADQRYATLATGQRGRPLKSGGTTNSSIAFSPDGKYLASGTGFPFNHTPKRSDLIVWDLARLGESKRDVPGKLLLTNEHVFPALNFTPDGRLLIAVDHDGVLRTWDTTSWALIQTAKLGRRATAMNISPDGKTLAIGFGRSLSDETGIILWDLPSMSQRRKLRTYRPMAIAFSPDGKTLVSTSENHKVALFDIRVGRQFLRLNEHQSYVFGAAFSGDSTMLATTEVDGVLRIWDGPTLREIDQNPTTLRALYRRGKTENRDGRYAEAMATLEYTLRLQQESLPSSAADVSKTRNELAVAIENRKVIETPQSNHPPP